MKTGYIRTSRRLEKVGYHLFTSAPCTEARQQEDLSGFFDAFGLLIGAY